MTLFGTEIRYGAVARALHWITAALVLTAWLIAGSWEDGNRAMLTLHETIGFGVFAIVAVRLLWRFLDRGPDHAAMPRVMAISSDVVHWLLYGLLFAIPATAIVGSWFEGHAITVYGIGALGPLLTTSRQLGHELLEIHELLGTAIVWVAGLHAAAALFHHFFMKDGVLRAMLPGRGA